MVMVHPHFASSVDCCVAGVWGTAPRDRQAPVRQGVRCVGADRTPAIRRLSAS